jgi:hypothetical protein
MSTLRSIIIGVGAELKTMIERLAPSADSVVDPKCAFREFKAEGENKDLKTTSSSAREFQIYPPGEVIEVGSGGNTQQVFYEQDVVFSYPDTPQWVSAAADDMAHIRQHLLAIPTTVSGVGARWVLPANPIRNEKAPEDLRRFYTVTVSVYADVTY